MSRIIHQPELVLDSAVPRELAHRFESNKGMVVSVIAARIRQDIANTSSVWREFNAIRLGLSTSINRGTKSLAVMDRKLGPPNEDTIGRLVGAVLAGTAKVVPTDCELWLLSEPHVVDRPSFEVKWSDELSDRFRANGPEVLMIQLAYYSSEIVNTIIQNGNPSSLANQQPAA